MKRIVCIVTLVALLLLNYSTTAFAEFDDLKEALNFELADASMTIIEGVEYRSDKHLNYDEFYAALTTEPPEYNDFVIGELKDGYKLCYNTIPGPPWMKAFYVQYDKYIFVNFLCEGEEGHGFYVKKGGEKLMLSEAFDKGITDIEEVVDIIMAKDITSSNPVCIVDTEKAGGNWKDLFSEYTFPQDYNTTEPITDKPSEPTTTEPTEYDVFVIGELKDGYELCFKFTPPPPWMEMFYYQYGKYIFVNQHRTSESGHGFYIRKDDEKLMLSEAFDNGITNIEEVVTMILSKNIPQFDTNRIVDTEKAEGNWKDLFSEFHFSQDDNTTEPITDKPSESATTEPTEYDVFAIGELKDGYELCYNTIPGPPWMKAFYVQYDKYIFVNFLCEGEEGHGFYVKKGGEKLMLSEAFDKGITDIEEVVDIIMAKDITSSNPVYIVDTEKAGGNWKGLFSEYTFPQNDNTTEPITEKPSETTTAEPTETTTLEPLTPPTTVPAPYNYYMPNFAKSATLAKTTYTYTGKEIKPKVTVKADGGRSVVDSKNYIISYTNNKKVGKATVTVTGKGVYVGSFTKTFKIVPKSTKLKVTGKKKAFTAKWKKNTTQTTGYQLQYATKSSFKGSKSVFVKKKTTSKTIKKLKAKKKYYVRIRTYKKVSGKMYYSSWSKVKKVKIKK